MTSPPMATGEEVVGAVAGASVTLGSPLDQAWTGAILANNVDLHTQRGGRAVGPETLCARY